MRRVSASVVMYGNAEETRCCLDSLAAHTKQPDFALYLVDNASPDGALAQLQNKPLAPCVRLCPQKKNRGYGAGHNAVLAELDSRYHAVINPDILVDEDVLAAMADWMDAHPDVAITTPRLVFPGGQPQYTAKRRPAVLPLLARQLHLPFLKKHETHYLMLDEDLCLQQDVEFCSGSFFMIRTDIYRQMGGFDEGYFMYVEDADITQKALRYGRAVYLPHVTVTHAWHRAAHKKPRQFFWQLKSMLRYFGKWGWKWK